MPAGDGLAERFHAEHDRTYGFAAPAEPVECVSLRLTSVGRIAKPPLQRLEPGETPEPKSRRPVYFAESGDYVDCGDPRPLRAACGRAPRRARR